MFELCSDCTKKYPRIGVGEGGVLIVDYWDCEICEGDTDPANWGYGTLEQIEEAAMWRRAAEI